MPKITDMIGKVNRYGIVQANNYRVVFGGIVGIEDTVIGTPGGNLEDSGSGKNNFNTRMSLSCESVSMPGRSLSTNPFKTIGVGIEVPYERLYSGDLEMTFLFGRDMQERKVFEKWMDNIINPDNNRFAYYKDYISDIDIIMFDEADKPIYKARIEEAYPKEIGAVSLSNDSSDLARQSITFSFKKYYPVDVSEEQGGMSSTEPSGLNGRISNLNSIGTDFNGNGWMKRGTSTIENYGHDGKVISRYIS